MVVGPRQNLKWAQDLAWEILAATAYDDATEPQVDQSGWASAGQQPDAAGQPGHSGQASASQQPDAAGVLSDEAIASQHPDAAGPPDQSGKASASQQPDAAGDQSDEAIASRQPDAAGRPVHFDEAAVDVELIHGAELGGIVGALTGREIGATANEEPQGKADSPRGKPEPAMPKPMMQPKQKKMPKQKPMPAMPKLKQKKLAQRGGQQAATTVALVPKQPAHRGRKQGATREVLPTCSSSPTSMAPDAQPKLGLGLHMDVMPLTKDKDTFGSDTEIESLAHDDDVPVPCHEDVQPPAHGSTPRMGPPLKPVRMGAASGAPLQSVELPASAAEQAVGSPRPPASIDFGMHLKLWLQGVLRDPPKVEVALPVQIPELPLMICALSDEAL